MDNAYVAIMAGGVGSRFWPKSRYDRPKQFLDILGNGKSLLQTTYDRLKNLCPRDQIYVLTNENYRPIVKDQLEHLPDSQILGEPMRKNTAPSIAYFAYKIASINPGANMVVTPADALITDEKSYLKNLRMGLKFTKDKNALVALGIRPTRPDTGYGYIQFYDEQNDGGIFKVKTFTEKPTLKLAKTFVKSGEFVWNSGIFIWNVKSILNAFREHLAEVNDVFADVVKHINTEREKAYVSRAFSLCPSISIDFGVMEKADNVYVIPSDFGWSDLGTWASLYENYRKDSLSNAISGKSVVVYDSSHCMVMAPDDKLVVLQGLDDFIIIDTEDVLLICEKAKEQEIKQMVNDLKRQKKEKYL